MQDPQFIIMWKDSGSQGKSRCVEAKGRNRCIKKCNLKLYNAKRKRFNKFCSETLLSSVGPKSSEMDQETVETCSLVRRVYISACFWEKWKSDSPCQKWSPTGSGLMRWLICIYVKVPLMRRLMLEFWGDICCRQDDYFSQELHVYFCRTMPGLILHKLQQYGFECIECLCLTGLTAVQICLLLKMYGTSRRGESDNGNHGLLSSSSLVYTKNGQIIHLTATIDIFSSEFVQK